ncbi:MULTISPECIES: DUF262 domain-containing protein [unclassified Methylobacterium]|jgi:Protein of unknown function DUF262|uniref:DUF262 domain-containing protein n=1 Tax=unclassified Methylobacterium TaxID=2615210 RepID=UPI001354DC18|nr:DUF262 domain-containing protein [Methylobacterium sp. 2A]MWV26066.1 DUF262 domain-containing protein [Methylobacterium sp. 2A]
MAEQEVLSRQLRSDAVDFSFGEIVNLHKANEIVIAPEYQRLFRWSDEQRSRLIESILVELPIPPIFLIEGEEGILELIDGLQRVSSVIQFISAPDIELSPLKLVGCDLIPQRNGKSFDDLSLTDRLRIKRTAVRAIVIRRQGDEKIKYELFKRLNTGGALLSAQEIRNCSSRMIAGGERFYKTLQELASNASFRTAIERLPESSIFQKGDEELVLRFFAVKNYLHGYKGNVEDWLDSYMEEILFERIAFDTAAESKVFEQVFNLISSVFGKDAFARTKGTEGTGRLAPAYFEAAVGGVLANLDEIAGRDPAQLRASLYNLYGSEEFREVTGPGANTIPKLNGRINLVSAALA